MKSKVILCCAVVVLATTIVAAQTCTAIQDGTLKNSANELLQTGYDSWGYNYQAHIFNGKYCDAYRNASWCQPYVNDDLEMKWNDAWLSNRDCNLDGLLDRPDDNGGTYIGSGAWVTNHQKGVYVDDKGKKQRWEYFVKIVAAPADAKLVGGTWVAADGTTIGASIWGAFAIVQELYNDTGSGDHGILYVSPYSAGLGRFAPEK